jgi:hypothetical protein
MHERSAKMYKSLIAVEHILGTQVVLGQFIKPTVVYLKARTIFVKEVFLEVANV